MPNKMSEKYVDFRQALLSESELAEFERLKTDREKIEFVAVAENDYPCICGTSGKDLVRASDYKEKGNLEFRNGRYDGAIQLYSLALRKAPVSGNDLGLRISAAHVSRIKIFE